MANIVSFNNVYNKLRAKKSKSIRRWKELEQFSVGIGVCAVFLSTSASRNSRIQNFVARSVGGSVLWHPQRLSGRDSVRQQLQSSTIINTPALLKLQVHFSEYFTRIRQCTGHVQVKSLAFSIYGSVKKKKNWRMWTHACGRQLVKKKSHWAKSLDNVGESRKRFTRVRHASLA